MVIRYFNNLAMQEASKAGLVKEIRAILDSTPNGLDCKQIENDYRNLVGNSLKRQLLGLGYNDVESFLVGLSREKLVDREQHYNGYIYRAAAADNKTARLQALVKKQVSKSKKGSRPLAGRSPAQPRPKVLPKAMQENVLTLLREKGQIPMSGLIKAYHDKYGVTFSYKSYGFPTLKDAMLSVERLNIEWKGGNPLIQAEPLAGNIISPSMSETFMCMPAFDNIRETLCRNLTKVLGDEEIALWKLPERYNKVIGTPCNPAKYGFNSWLCLVNSLVNTVNLRRGEDDEWMVSHISRPTPVKEKSSPPRKQLSNDLKEQIRRVIEDSGGVSVDSFDEKFTAETNLELSPSAHGYKTMESLLIDVLTTDMEIVATQHGRLIRMKPPKVLISDIVDAVGPGVRYNKPQLPPLNQYIELKVSEIVTPSNFYVQLMPHLRSGLTIEKLMDDLERVYNALEARNVYRLPGEFVRPGQLVVCRYPNDMNWHRARITQILRDNFVQVFFVDYGTVCSVHQSSLFYLRTQFLTLPMQAQNATLYGIAPIEPQGWTNTAIKSFFNLATGKNLCAMVMAFNKEQKMAMCLSDVTGAIDLHINDYLVTSQFAIFTDLSAQLPKSSAEKVDEAVNWDVSSDDDESDIDDGLDVKWTQPVAAAALPTTPQRSTSLSTPSPHSTTASAATTTINTATNINTATTAIDTATTTIDTATTTIDTATTSIDTATTTIDTATTKDPAVELPAHSTQKMDSVPQVAPVPVLSQPVSFAFSLPPASAPPTGKLITSSPLPALEPTIPPLEPSPGRTLPTATVKPQKKGSNQSGQHPAHQQPLSLTCSPLYQQPFTTFHPQPEISPISGINTKIQANGGDGPPPLEPVEFAEGNGLPALIHVSQLGRDDSGDGPPPLIHTDVVRATSKQPAGLSPRDGRSFAVETLKHRLKGLELQRNRLQVEQYHAAPADDSGPESSDSEMSALDSEINALSSQLVKMTGVARDATPVRKRGRGRGAFQLSRLASNE